MGRDAIDTLFLVFLGYFDFFEVFVWFLWFSDPLGTFWCYSEALGNVAVFSAVTALELELWFFKIDLDAVFSELSVSQKDRRISEFHNVQGDAFLMWSYSHFGGYRLVDFLDLFSIGKNCLCWEFSLGCG